MKRQNWERDHSRETSLWQWFPYMQSIFAYIRLGAHSRGQTKSSDSMKARGHTGGFQKCNTDVWPKPRCLYKEWEDTSSPQWVAFWYRHCQVDRTWLPPESRFSLTSWDEWIVAKLIALFGYMYPKEQRQPGSKGVAQYCTSSVWMGWLIHRTSSSIHAASWERTQPVRTFGGYPSIRWENTWIPILCYCFNISWMHAWPQALKSWHSWNYQESSDS